MIGLDTNVIVHYIMRDDARQAARATRLIEALSAEQPGFVPLPVTIELVWVLQSAFDLDRAQVATALDLLLRASELRLDRADLVIQALRVYRAGNADFAAALIERVASAQGCSATMTFDAAAARSAGMTLVPD